MEEKPEKKESRMSEGMGIGIAIGVALGVAMDNIALGHPLGYTGAKLTTQLLHEMKRRDSRYGLVTMCVGGGMGAAGIFENLN